MAIVNEHAAHSGPDIGNASPAMIRCKQVVTVSNRILNPASDFAQKRLCDAKALRKLSANGQEQMFQRTINRARVAHYRKDWTRRSPRYNPQCTWKYAK